jgi:hypothetical protein
MGYEPIQLIEKQITQFQEDGFLILEKFLPPELIAQLTEHMSSLFYGNFETGIYPDEWYWRPQLSLPDVTRRSVTLGSAISRSPVGTVRRGGAFNRDPCRLAWSADWSGQHVD